MFKQGVNNTDLVNFLEDYKRYRVEIFNLNEFFIGLSNDVSHFVVLYNLFMFKQGVNNQFSQRW